MRTSLQGKRLNSLLGKQGESLCSRRRRLVPLTRIFIHQSVPNDNRKSILPKLSERRQRKKRKEWTPWEGRDKKTSTTVGQRCPMEFCDLNCRYARWPEERAVDGAESCRTFQAVFCEKRNRLVHKNAPCSEKKKKPRGIARRPEP